MKNKVKYELSYQFDFRRPCSLQEIAMKLKFNVFSRQNRSKLISRIYILACYIQLLLVCLGRQLYLIVYQTNLLSVSLDNIMYGILVHVVKGSNLNEGFKIPIPTYHTKTINFFTTCHTCRKFTKIRNHYIYVYVSYFVYFLPL